MRICCINLLRTQHVVTDSFEHPQHIVAISANATDPNLVLSCLSAVQAPIIMMSQNRQEARDRARARNDYHVNLKAEVEIRLLHEKIDHLLRHQLRRWTEIQQAQFELMADLDRGAKSRL